MTDRDRMKSAADAAGMDPVAASIGYELIEMLLLVRDKYSFKEIGNRVGRDERTISRQLLELDKNFWDTQHIHILERDRGRKSYHLTPSGRAFVDQLAPMPKAIIEAIAAATAARRRVPVLCTSNCLHYFLKLRELLPTDSGFGILPLSRRTAEIDLLVEEEQSATRIGLLSALMSSEQCPTVGSVAQWNDRIQVLPLEVESVKLLSVEDLNVPGPVSVHDLIESGVTFITPTGGLVWDFLNRSFPGWRVLRPFQHYPVPDLDFGLKCLAGKVIPRSVMVVHGISYDAHGNPFGIEDARLQEFATSAENSHQLLAVIGVFYVRDESPTDEPDPFDLIWETAQALWSDKERVL